MRDTESLRVGLYAAADVNVCQKIVFVCLNEVLNLCEMSQ